jgi:AraC-like DNA-binding protein
VKNYFVYLPDDRAETAWECTATAAGYTRVSPGNDYPPLRHPVDHHFSWSKGRILDAYQIVFITEGTGWFESGRARRKHRVEAGTAFLLFPKVWHRYAPDAETGWVEHWIECRGRAFDRAKELGLINPKRPVLRTGLDPDLLQCFERCHALAQRSASGRQAALATLGLHILALLEHAGTGSIVERQKDDVIQRAQLWIAERYPETLNMQQLARELNVSYSWFRHAFRSRTGLSPKQYHVQMRLQKAQDFLANTAKSVKEIAAILGFDSPYHLSAQFKDHSGLAPDRWRRRLRRSA